MARRYIRCVETNYQIFLSNFLSFSKNIKRENEQVPATYFFLIMIYRKSTSYNTCSRSLIVYVYLT